MRILLDSDVSLDFVLEREPFFAGAEEIFELYGNGEIEIFLAAVSLTNIFYIVRKQKGQDAAFDAVETLLTTVEICPVDKAVLQNAFISGFADFEDAVQNACAVENNLDAIVTRNLADYKNAALPVFSPFDFLQKLKTP